LQLLRASPEETERAAQIGSRRNQLSGNPTKNSETVVALSHITVVALPFNSHPVVLLSFVRAFPPWRRQ
jgi:hypothetical protein